MKRNENIASLVMLVSLGGLLSFQGFWISTVFNQTKNEIEADVRTTLSDVSRSLLIDKLGHISGVRIVQPRPNASSDQKEYAYFDGDSITAQISLGDSPSINVMQQGNRESVVTLNSNNSSFSINNADLKINRPDSLRRARNSVGTNSIEVNQTDFNFMDSLLTQGLSKYGLERDYFFGYWNEGDQKFTYTNQQETKDLLPTEGQWYSVSSFVLGNSSSNSLFLKFPDNRVTVASFSGIGTIIIASIIMILLLVSAWFYTVRSLRKQYQVAQIKDDFISNMTHELKTPVTASSLALEVMAKNSNVQEDNGLKELVVVARHEQKRILDMIDTILDSTTVDNRMGKALELINLSEAVHSAINSIKISVEEAKGKINFKQDSEALNVLGEPLHLQNAIINIFDNAIKYSEIPQISVRLEKEGAKVKLSISDLGKGIAPTDQSKIFDRFFRVHTGNIHTVKGYGLGLSYTKAIVESCGGSVTVESDGIQGSKFTIKLPLADEG